MFDESSKIGKKVAGLLAKEAKTPNHGVMPLYNENGVYNFYLKLGSSGSIAPLEEVGASGAPEMPKELQEAARAIAAWCAKSGNTRHP